MHHVFVYGSLKDGFHNAHVLKDALFVDFATTVPAFRLWSLGSYPAITEDEERGYSIKGEVYQVNDEEMAQLRALEAMYKETSVFVTLDQGGEMYATAFVYPRSLEGKTEIVAGEWKTNKYGPGTKYHAHAYPPRA